LLETADRRDSAGRSLPRPCQPLAAMRWSRSRAQKDTPQPAVHGRTLRLKSWALGRAVTAACILPAKGIVTGVSTGGALSICWPGHSVQDAVARVAQLARQLGPSCVRCFHRRHRQVRPAARSLLCTAGCGSTGTRTCSQCGVPSGRQLAECSHTRGPADPRHAAPGSAARRNRRHLTQVHCMLGGAVQSDRSLWDLWRLSWICRRQSICIR
jgi:hypothetical protein